MRKILTIIIASILFTTKISAQVGEYRNKYSIGIGGGYTLNRIGFLPTVTQNMHGGYTCGLTARYTCEKYFSTLCAVQMEVNMTQLGWRERIETIDGAPVMKNGKVVSAVVEQKHTHTGHTGTEHTYTGICSCQGV